MQFHFKRLLYSNTGKYIISMILGVGLASLFRKSCSEKRCIRFIGPHIKNVEDKVFKYNDKCYKYKPTAESCNKSKKQIKFDIDEELKNEEGFTGNNYYNKNSKILHYSKIYK